MKVNADIVHDYDTSFVSDSGNRCNERHTCCLLIRLRRLRPNTTYLDVAICASSRIL